MKTARLRIEITVEDAVSVDLLQARLRAVLDRLGTEQLPDEPGDGDLAGPKPGGRIFWQTAEVKRHAEADTPAPRRKKAG